MKRGALKKLNRGKSAEDVQEAVLSAGFAPFREGDIPDLSEMTIYKAAERHTRRKKKTDGIFVKLQSFSFPEGAENCEFIALSADKKLQEKGPDGKKISPLYCRLFVKTIKDN